MTLQDSESTYVLELPDGVSQSALARWRIENLRALVNIHGGFSALARRLGYANSSALSHLIGKSPKRPISETIARRIEIKLGLGRGELDEPPSTTKMAPGRSPTVAADEEVRRLIVAAAVKTMGCVLQRNGWSLAQDQELELTAWVLQLVQPLVER